jgi:hypothetical protein
MSVVVGSLVARRQRYLSYFAWLGLQKAALSHMQRDQKNCLILGGAKLRFVATQ